MKSIYYQVNGITLDLNGEMLDNVCKAINHPECYVEHEHLGGVYRFKYLANGVLTSSFITNKKSEMYAYMCGLLNFRMQ